MISAGESLEIYEKDLRCRGNAIQCRIYSEDPETYAPCTGVVDDLFVPMGPQVRHELIAHSGWRFQFIMITCLQNVCMGNERSMIVTKDDALAQGLLLLWNYY